MKKLVIDTTDNILRIALIGKDVREGKCLEFILQPRELESRLVPEIKKIVRGDFKKISSIIICVGPGSFTGSRLGISFAKAMSFFQIEIREFSWLYMCKIAKIEDEFNTGFFIKNDGDIYFKDKNNLTVAEQKIYTINKEWSLETVHKIVENSKIAKLDLEPLYGRICGSIPSIISEVKTVQESDLFFAFLKSFDRNCERYIGKEDIYLINSIKEKVITNVVVYKVEKDQLKIYEFITNKLYRGKGEGTRMLKKMTSIAHNMTEIKSVLITVEKDNKPAISLLLKNKFEQNNSGKHPNLEFVLKLSTVPIV
ncbi:MAG: GNAT family N-acetyltransferase [Alphaproteobacteria bacterium]|nr:GNAT family N-acetyltransferase [Alphaproteobacteria bacterium]